MDSGSFNLYFDNTLEEHLKEALGKENLDINNIKGAEGDELSPDDWNKLGDILSNVAHCNDPFLKNILHELNNDTLYGIVIKTLCHMLDKGNDKINIIFKPPQSDYLERIRSFSAFCIYELRDNPVLIIETADTVKDKKKKSIKVPEIPHDLKKSKLFARTPECNVMIYDKTAEFVVRNKILTECLRTINPEIDNKPIFKQFNEIYENMVNTSKISQEIQLYSYGPEDFIPLEASL